MLSPQRAPIAAAPAIVPHPWRIAPGLILAAIIAGLAFAIQRIPGMGVFSPMILAIIIGMAFHNTIGTPAQAKPGLAFALKRVLRLAIVLLGLQLTFTQMREVGIGGLTIIFVSLTATFFFTKWFARLIGVERKLAELIAAGTSICGASAVIAMNTVTEAPDEDVAYGVACVTLFGGVAVLFYPLLAEAMALSPRHYGLWTGASIHEIAQVVAAAFQRGPEAGHIATVAKLSRVMMLAPMVFGLGLAAHRHKRADGGAVRAAAPIPWFVLGFVALVSVNSMVIIPPLALRWIALVTTFLLSLALAAMGLETYFRKLMAEGLKPVLLGGASWLFIAVFSLLLIEFTG